MVDIFDPYFRGLSPQEQELLEVLVYDLIERAHDIGINSFNSYLRVLERLPDVFGQIQSNFKFDFDTFKKSVDDVMHLIHQEPDEEVIKQLALFRSFIARSG